MFFSTSRHHSYRPQNLLTSTGGLFLFVFMFVVRTKQDIMALSSLYLVSWKTSASASARWVQEEIYHLKQQKCLPCFHPLFSSPALPRAEKNLRSLKGYKKKRVTGLMCFVLTSPDIISDFNQVLDLVTSFSWPFPVTNMYSNISYWHLWETFYYIYSIF